MKKKTEMKLSKAAQKWAVPKCGIIKRSEYPATGTYARRIWDIADEITAGYSRFPTTKEVIAKAMRSKISKEVTRVQLSLWKKAHPGYKKIVKSYDKKNGITVPGEGTKTRRIWDISNALMIKHKDIKIVYKKTKKMCADEGINKHTITTQLFFWKTYNGW